MDFINTLTAKGQEVAQKAKETAELFKWHNKISTEQDRIKKAYEDIGRLFCALNPESPSEEYFDFYAQIDESKQLIEQYKKEIAKIKNIGCCKKCGAPLDRDAKYCSVCGASQEEGKKEERSESVICPYCGEAVDPGSICCPHCGKNIK